MTKFLYYFRARLVLVLTIITIICCACVLRSAVDLRQPHSVAFNAATPESLASDDPPSLEPSPNPEPDPPEDLLQPTPPTTIFEFHSDLVILALNPGYTVDGVRDSGEFIELKRLSDESLDLTDYGVRYINTSGKAVDLVQFADGSILHGETLLLGLARTMSDYSDLSYMTTIAMSAGTIQLTYRDEIVDEVCWGKEPCYTGFKSATPTSLVRDLATGEFAHQPDYQPTYDPSQPSLSVPAVPDDSETPDQPPSDAVDSPDDQPSASSVPCRGFEFTEVLTYYAEAKTEQFIELHNFTDQAAELSACRLKYKNKTYPLDGTVAPDGYYAIYPQALQPSLTLTKNPNTSNTIELVDQDDQVVDFLIYNHGQKKSTSFALFYDASGEEIWQQTYHPTAGAANLYQEFRTCPAGKVINPATGNCVKATSVSSHQSTDCPAGKYRNPLTGRCKTIASSSNEPKPCAEGYERNPETNRCRKISATNEGAGYALVPTTRSSSKSTFVAFGIVVLLVTGGIIYIVIQFRREIARAFRKIRQRFHHIAKDDVPRRTRFHRHK